MRRLSTALMAAVLVGIALAIAAPGALAAGTAHRTPRAPAVQVVKVSGLLDPIMADFLDQSITEAERVDAPALVLRINSTGSVISDGRLDALAHTIADSSIPIIAWIGPSGARAEGDTAQLLAVVDTVGIAPGGSIGKMGDPVVDRALWTPAFVEHRGALRNGLLDADAAADAGLTVPTKDALVLRRVLLQVPGFRAKSTKTVSATPVEFAQLSTGKNLMHTFASPAVAQLLFVIGLALILFELYTAGIGVAGLTGAACVIFGCYGLAVLPVRPIAIALIVASMVAYAVDIQVGTPRFWTAAGSVVFAVGLLTLYQGIPMPWLSTIGAIVAMVVFMVFGMPAMTRSRFSTPMIARDWLIGRTGTVVDTLHPDGVLRIGEGLWAARAAGDAIAAGAAVRVTGIEGVVCRVELDEQTNGATMAGI